MIADLIIYVSHVIKHASNLYFILIGKLQDQDEKLVVVIAQLNSRKVNYKHSTHLKIYSRLLKSIFDIKSHK